MISLAIPSTILSLTKDKAPSFDAADVDNKPAPEIARFEVGDRAAGPERAERRNAGRNEGLADRLADGQILRRFARLRGGRRRNAHRPQRAKACRPGRIDRKRPRSRRARRRGRRRGTRQQRRRGRRRRRIRQPRQGASRSPLGRDGRHQGLRARRGRRAQLARTPPDQAGPLEPGLQTSVQGHAMLRDRRGTVRRGGNRHGALAVSGRRRNAQIEGNLPRNRIAAAWLG